MNVDALKDNLKDLEEEIAQAEKIGLGDFLIAGMIALLVVFASFAWELPYLHPSNWNELVVAGGVRPTANILPGFFTLVGGIVSHFFGLARGTEILKVVGHCSLAFMAVLVFMAFREVLVFIMRARPQFSRRRTLVMRAGGAVGAFAFVFAEPVWMLGQFFSEGMVLLLLTLFAIEFFFAFLRKGSLAWSYLCAITLGLLCAETPLGFLLLVVFLVLNHIVLKVLPVFESPFFRPEIIAVGKWYMTFLFIAAFLIGAALNSVTYVMHDGLVANGGSIGSIPLGYLLAYWGQITHAANMAGWILLLGVCVTPFVVTVVRFPVAADEEVFLSYSTGIVFLVCGLAAFSQCASLPALWFWTHSSVYSSYLLAFGLLMSAATLAGSITILGVDNLCRNHRRLSLQMFGRDEDVEAARRLEQRQRGWVLFLRRVGFVAVPLAAVILMLPARMKCSSNVFLQAIREAIEETIREAGKSEYLFTGGHLDTIIEFESAAHGGRIKCLPLVGGQSARDRYLRTRGMTDDAEDTFAFNYDVGMGLRTWIRDKPARLDACAIQMGFDLWKRDGKPLPPMGGLLSRPTGWDDADRLASVARGHALCNRFLDILAHNSVEKCTDKAVRDAFNAVLWRLARMCLTRAEANDFAGDPKGAIEENNLGNSLNEKNGIYREIMESLARTNEKMMQRLTPREGLQLALVRADFNMGQYYANIILKADPEDGDSNFALGMYYAKKGQYHRAEEYLMRCLLVMPNQPSIYNNLAMVQLELGKLDEAERNAEKALTIVPDAAAVMETKNRIKKAREAKDKPARPVGGLEKLKQELQKVQPAN